MGVTEMTIEPKGDSRGQAESVSFSRRRSASAGVGRYAAALVLLLMTASGCGSEDSNSVPDEPGKTEDPGQDFTTFDVTWREDAVRQELSEVQRALVRADYEKGEFVFSSDYAGLEQLEMGRFALLGGVGIFQIVGREDVEDGVLVSVEPGMLTDIIEDGTIAWRRSFVSAPDDSKLGLGIGESEVDSIQSLRQPLAVVRARKARVARQHRRVRHDVRARARQQRPRVQGDVEAGVWRQQHCQRRRNGQAPRPHERNEHRDFGTEAQRV